MLYEVCRSCLWAFTMRVTEALATKNQQTHHKTFAVHEITKPTPVSWYYERKHYFADSD